MHRRCKKKINLEIEAMYPDFVDKAKLLVYYSKLKSHILYTASVWMKDNQTKEELDEIERQKRYFITNGTAKSSQELSLDISRSFITLCSIMEENGSTNPSNYSVIQFYGKLDYLNKQTIKENESNRSRI